MMNIESLVVAAERQDSHMEAPGLEVRDKIAFIINNIAQTNLGEKSKEVLEILKEEYYPWFAQYMVVKRASIEHSFHDLYLKFLTEINSRELEKEIINATSKNCKVLLRSELIKSSSNERILLKNLGRWLGKLTIGRNKRLRDKDVNLYLLIIEAYEKGLLIAVIPFIVKILESIQSSEAYMPPNPWTVQILRSLVEVHALPQLNPTIKYEIEVLFSNLRIYIEAVKPSQILKRLAWEIEGNPDISNEYVAGAQNSVCPHRTGMRSSISQLELHLTGSSSHTSSPHTSVSSSSAVDDEKQTTLAVLADCMPSGLGLSDKPGFHKRVEDLIGEWARIYDSPGVNNQAYAIFISHLQQSGMIKGDDNLNNLLCVLTELSVDHCSSPEMSMCSSISCSSPEIMQGLYFTPIDMYAKFVVLLVEYCAEDLGMTKVNLLNKVLAITVHVLQRDAKEKERAFHPIAYFRLFTNWLMDFNSTDSVHDTSNFEVLTAFANAFHSLQPSRVPGWSSEWLELISHRNFIPKLLLSNYKRGWPLVQQLLVDLLKFLEPYLRKAELPDPVQTLYKGTVKVLVFLQHDFSEFLCNYHLSFCDVIPTSCIELRNIILSAFPHNVKLPDPFSPNLKVDLLPEISQSPIILSEVDGALIASGLKAEVDQYLKTLQTISPIIVDFIQCVLLPQREVLIAGTDYNIPLINSLVLYVGMQLLEGRSTAQQLPVSTNPVDPAQQHSEWTGPMHSASVDIFDDIMLVLESESRYLVLNAIANQLRYPNNHTHYFSCVLLHLFTKFNQEFIQEQIVIVLLERLLVNKPHPWGIYITFHELINNPCYDFWSFEFPQNPRIKNIYESVARTYMEDEPPFDEGDI